MAELGAIERHLASLPKHSGAVVSDDPDLGVLLVRAGSGGQNLDYGALPRWPEPAAEQLTAFEKRFRDEGRWPSLLITGATPGNGLAARLARSNWSELPAETVLWTRHPAAVPHLDPTLRLEAVTRRSSSQHEALERRIFGLPQGSAPERVKGLVSGLEDGTLRAFLVRSRGEPVAVARLSLLEGMAGLYGIGVAPERRRKGLGTLITAIAMRAGLATGKPLVWLSVEDGNDGARRLYEGLGLRPALRWSRWIAPLT